MTDQVQFAGEPLRFHILSKEVDKLGEILPILRIARNGSATEAFHYAAFTRFQACCELSMVVALLLHRVERRRGARFHKTGWGHNLPTRIVKRVRNPQDLLQGY